MINSFSKISPRNRCTITNKYFCFTVDMVEFLKVGFKEIPTLSGLKYTHNNLDEGIRCVQLYDKKFTIFLGCDQVNVNELKYLQFD